MNQFNNTKEAIYQFVLTNGPLIPLHVAKNFKTEILMASAHLSELVAEKKLSVTKFLKIGTSPLYFSEGQEAKLVNFLSYLPERPKQIAELLQETKILRDKTIEPWQRVALREISDFAVPIKIKTSTDEEIFWRWYLFPQNEAEDIINKFLKQKTQEIQSQLPIKQKEPKKQLTGNFENEIIEYLNKYGLKILNRKVIRKNKDLEFESIMKTSIGEVNVYIKAKNKSKISDSDLSLALSLNAEKKTPIIFLTNGELTKKAEKFLARNKLILFRNIYDKPNTQQ